MKFDDIEHIIIGGEMTLCGYAIDIEVQDIGISEDEFQEELEKLKQNKIEYGSDCKGCIKLLKELRAIKK